MGNDPLNGHSGNDQLPTGNQLKLSIFLLSRFPLKEWKTTRGQGTKNSIGRSEIQQGAGASFKF